MEMVRKLTADPDYRRFLARTAEYETERPYCCHGFDHLLSVARIAWILALERELEIPRPVIYTAALLHDIGRFLQYEDNVIDHAEASAELAEPLLAKYGFTKEETATILQAIRSHRLPTNEVADQLGAVLAEADDLSRACYDCSAQEGCYKFERMATAKGICY